MNNEWGMVKKNLMSHITVAILCALVTFVGSAWLGALLGSLIFVMFLVMQYADGCDRGERACTLRDTIDKLESAGKKPDEAMLAQTYNPKKAVKAFLISSLPLALLALVNLIVADPNAVGETILGTITRIVFFPAAWLTRMMTDSVGIDLTGAFQAVDGIFAGIERTGVNMGATLKSLASIGEYAVAYDLYYLTIMRAAYVVIAFMMPLAMMLGYMRGEKLRAQRLKEIAAGSRRKAKKLKMFAKPKQRKQIKPEV